MKYHSDDIYWNIEIQKSSGQKVEFTPFLQNLQSRKSDAKEAINFAHSYNFHSLMM